jgi:uncharacterized repeat protein (TIGR01451 family)
MKRNKVRNLRGFLAVLTALVVGALVLFPVVSVAATSIQNIASVDYQGSGIRTGTSNQTTVTVLTGNFWDPLTKSVDPPGRVGPNTIVTYTNTFGNNGGAPATNAVIADVLDANLIYINGSATEPPGITGTGIVYDPVVRTITWTIPSVPAGYVGTVSFRAQIDPTVPSDTTVSNVITLTSDQSPAAETSNIVTTAVVENTLQITKSANKSVAEIGDSVVYTLVIENASSTTTAGDVMITDVLPHGFRYVKGSTTLDGSRFHDSSGGTTLTWQLGNLSPDTSKTLRYSAVISVDAPLGDGINRASISGKTPGNNNLFAGPSSTTVKVKEGVLNTRGIILGRVFVDTNRDRMPDDNEPGVQGIRLYLEDGTYVITDEQGKFSLFGITAGEHVLKIDKMTIPDGYKSVPLDSSFAGSGNSRFISVPFGGPARGDFALVPIQNRKNQILRKAEREKHERIKNVRYTGENQEDERSAFRNQALNSVSNAQKREKNKQLNTKSNKPKKKKKFTFSTQKNPAEVPLEKQILTMPATVALLKPSKGTSIRKTWTDIIIRVPDNTEYTVKVNNDPLPAKKIARIIHEKRKKISIYEYVAINLDPGPNTLVLEAKGPKGEIFVKGVQLSVAGLPEKMVITPDKADIPADGETIVPFTVLLKDKWDRPSIDEQLVTVISEKGEILEEDLYPSDPGHQLKVRQGKATFRFRSTLKSGKDELRILLGNVLEEKADLYLTTDLRDWIIVGIGQLTVGNREVSGNLEGITEKDDFDEGIYQDGRLAFFAKGKILGKYLLTATYDSDKEERDELFQQVEPDRYYPVYGDASEIGYEAESQEKYYVKIERERSSIMYGDYNTDLTENEFTRYTRTLNGAKADIETDHIRVKAFGTSTNQTITKDEIRGNGTSGFYFLSKKPVIENSERITIEIRDRYHPEKILAVTEKTRYSDYEIDYRNGKILFKEPVPSTDAALNQVMIVVTYESDDPGDEYYIYGGRASYRPREGTEVGVTAIVEEQDIEDSKLYGADATVRIAEKTELRAEVAMSETLEKGDGSAWKMEFRSMLFERLKIEMLYRNVDTDFLNSSMTGTETGTEKYGARADLKVTETTHVQAESFVHNDKINRTKLKSNTVGVKQKVYKAYVDAGYQHLREKSQAEGDKESQVLYAGVRGNITDKLGASVRRDQALTSDEIADYQTKTAIGMDYKLTENTRAYVTQEFQEGEENKKDTTLVGIESRVTENTTVTSKYHMENAVSGERAQASIGLNNKWEVQEGLTVNTRAERIQEVKGDNDEDNTAFAVSAEYLPGEDFKATGRYELRLGETETTNLSTFGVASKVSKSTTLLGKASLWHNRMDAGTDALYDGLVGIAYRPLGKSSLYLLSTLRYRYDRQGSSDTNDEIQSLISSSEFSYRLRPPLTLLGKYAGKYNWEDVDNDHFESYTDLILAGLNFDLTSRWYAGVYSKLMNQYQTSVHSIGYVIKTGYNVYRNLFLGIGYNSAELNDNDL